MSSPRCLGESERTRCRNGLDLGESRLSLVKTSDAKAVNCPFEIRMSKLENSKLSSTG